MLCSQLCFAVRACCQRLLSALCCSHFVGRDDPRSDSLPRSRLSPLFAQPQLARSCLSLSLAAPASHILPAVLGALAQPPVDQRSRFLNLLQSIRVKAQALLQKNALKEEHDLRRLVSGGGKVSCATGSAPVLPTAGAIDRVTRPAWLRPALTLLFPSVTSSPSVSSHLNPFTFTTHPSPPMILSTPFCTPLTKSVS